MPDNTQRRAESLVLMAQEEIDKERGACALFRAWTSIVALRHLAQWDQINQAITRLAHLKGFENRSQYLYQNENEEHVYVVYLFNPQASL